MNIVTRTELEAAGLVPNRHMWIGDGWIYCPLCARNTLHDAWSHKGDSDCFEVCKSCECYSGPNRLRRDVADGETVTT